jgi:hypothetical protein
VVAPIPDLDARVAIIEQKYLHLMDIVREHMEREERERGEQRLMLKEIYDLLRNGDRLAAQGDSDVEQRVREHLREFYATKTETAKMRGTAVGISIGISLLATVIGLLLNKG